MFETYTGKMGSGKTYHAVRVALDELKKGRKVWVNFTLDYRLEFPDIDPNLCQWFTDVEDLAYMRDGLMIMDEAHSKLSARDWQDTTKATREYISQSRHLHMDLILISQDHKRLEPIPRELTETVVEHKKIGGGFDPKKGKYREPILMWASSFIPADVDRQKRVSLGTKYFRFDKKIAACYNTDELFGELLKELPPKTFVPSYYHFSELKNVVGNN